MTPQTKKVVDELFVAIRGLISRTVHAKTDEIERRLAAVEQRVAADFEPGKTYERGVIVRHGEQLWAATYKTRRPPSSGGASWTKVWTR